MRVGPNAERTQWLCTHGDERPLLLDDISLPPVQDMYYLGVWLSSDARTDVCFNARIAKTWGKFYAMSDIFNSSNLCSYLKTRLLQAHVFAVLD